MCIITCYISSQSRAKNATKRIVSDIILFFWKFSDSTYEHLEEKKEESGSLRRNSIVYFISESSDSGGNDTRKSRGFWRRIFLSQCHQASRLIASMNIGV